MVSSIIIDNLAGIIIMKDCLKLKQHCIGEDIRLDY